MTRSWYSAAVWSCVAAALVGFVLPWAQLDIGTSKSSRELSSDVRHLFKKGGTAHEPSWIRHRKNPPAVPTKVSGIEIPAMVNRKNVKVAVQLMKLLTRTDRGDVGLKSYAVYLLPGIALGCGLLLSAWGEQWFVCLSAAALCVAVAGGGFWMLLTTDTKTQFAIVIGPGLWLSLWAYAGLSAVALLAALPARAARTPR